VDWIAWDETLDTGHARMDAEHQELAQLFARLQDAVENGECKADCAKVFDGIIDHAKAHFELEQRLMTQHQYPKLEQHAAEHAMLVRQALDYRQGFDVDTAAGRSTLMQFPEVWLAYHILFSDKELAAFLARPRSSRQTLDIPHGRRQS
jgi:hemerythrin